MRSARFGDVIAALLALAPLVASAQANPVSTLTGGRVVNTATHLNNSWTTVKVGNAANASRFIDMAAPGGRVAANTMTVAMTQRGVLTVVASGLRGLAWPLAVGGAAWAVYDAVRVRPDPFTGGLAYDPGQQGTPTQSVCWVENGDSSPAACLPTPEAAYVFRHGPLSASSGCYYGGAQTLFWEWQLQSVAAGRFAERTTGCPAMPGFPNGSPAGYTGSYRYYVRQIVNGVNCPAITLGGQVQAGLTGYDGLCPTGSYSQQMTPGEAAYLRETANIALPDPKVLLDSVMGTNPLPIPAGSLVEVGNSVPFVQGPVTTTNNSNGTVTEVATGWDFARDPVNKNQGTYTPKTTTTQKDANGNPIGAPVVTTGAQGNPTEAEDPCTYDPGRLGCLGLGTVPTEPIPGVSIPVAIVRDQGWQAVGACPADKVLNLARVTVTVPFTMLCAAADMARPIIIGVAWVTAIFGFLGLSRRD